MAEQENKELEVTLNNFFQGLQAGLKSLKEVREVYDEQVAFEFNSVNFFGPNENKISEILAFFLNPHETHGQKDKFLKVFLDKFEIKSSLEILGSKKSVKVRTEYTTNKKRRIDIFIDLGGFMIGIENKIWGAVDQKNQLQHYADFLKKKSKGKYKLFFLPSHSYNPSEQSIKKKSSDELKDTGKLQIISFKKDIIELFEQFELACKADNVRAFIKDFNKYLKQKFLGEKIMGESDFIKDSIGENPIVLKHATAIINGLNDVREDMKKSFYASLLKLLKEEYEYEIDENKSFARQNRTYKIEREDLKELNDINANNGNVFIEYRPHNGELFIGLFRDGETNCKNDKVTEFINKIENTSDKEEYKLNTNGWWGCEYLLHEDDTSLKDDDFLSKLLDKNNLEKKISKTAEDINIFIENAREWWKDINKS